MKVNFRKIEEADKDTVIDMMREFYSSDALYTNGSEEIFNSNLQNVLNNSDYIEGYVFCDNKDIVGYSLLAKSFSTEFGRECIWFEDFYLKKNYRNLGIIPDFISHIKNTYKDKIFRLEVEKENKHAVHVYEKAGFKLLPYVEYYFVN